MGADACPSRATLDPARVDAVIFDLDGVLTHTATVHAAAWKATFDAFLVGRAGATAAVVPFDVETDYRRWVDGKPRRDGIRSFLASRGIALPEGEAGDPPGRETVWGLAHRKNELFQARLAREGPGSDAAAAALVGALRARGVRVAVVSASENAMRVLRAAGLEEQLDVRVDGTDAGRLGLAGKPAPDLFLEAARRLGVSPARAAVVEDAVAGVTAARRGGFGTVIGVDRLTDGARLREAGAGVVVRDLGAIVVAPHTGAGRPSALAAFDAAIRPRFAGRRVAAFLDYDGTLTPIVARPEDAVLPARMREAVGELSRHCPVAIVSGRDRRVVEELVGIPGLAYVGSHGLDVAGPRGSGLRHEPASPFLPTLDLAEATLRERLAGVAGVLVERKRFTIAVHVRRVAGAEHGTVEAVVDAVRALHASLRKERGKAVFELRPDIDWDKGRAVLWLLEALGLDDGVPIYVGDDLTDEAAFTALAGRGIGIVVGAEERASAAAYGLHDPTEVERFVRGLAAALRGRAS